MRTELSYCPAFAMATRSPDSFLDWLIPKLPTTSS
jgi:hypothetical protein